MLLRKFSRNPKLRATLLRQLLNNLVENRKITTTRARAKTVRRLFDRTITYIKRGNFRCLNARGLPKRSFLPLLGYARSMRDRTGGYLAYRRMINRAGDGASMIKLAFLN